jgi:hypothetical protein
MGVDSGLMIVARGDITIAGNVTRVEGFYITNGRIIIENGPAQINLRGGFVSYYNGGGQGVELNRNPGGELNEEPAEDFEYGDDIVNALSRIQELRIFKYTWSEANPLNQ